MRKKKLRKVGLCFVTGCFIKPLQMIINHFFLFLKLIRSAIFAFWYQGYWERQLARGNWERGNWERQLARDGKLNICFKNNLNLSVMNVTQLNFFDWQNVHISHFIIVNHKRNLLFVVVPTLISWSKTKFFTGYNDKI